MKIKGYEFSVREFAGSMGDFGTLLPIIIAYIVVVGMNPASLLIMFGISNIILGLVYNLPLPLQPKKAIASVAISQKWTSAMVQGAGLSLGLLWFILIFTGLIEKIVKYTPKSVIRGIQVGLGILLMKSGVLMIYEKGIILGIIAVAIIIIFRKKEKAPISLILLFLGLCIMIFNNQLLELLVFSFSLPEISIPSLNDIFLGFFKGGLAQIPLTLSNAVIATAAVLMDYFPQKAPKKISEKKLLTNMGVMNTIVPLFGGMPQCHGAGGLAAQYSFGARTGGANIMEGIVEILLGLFLAQSIKDIFILFPMSIVGAMMIYVGFQLGKFSKKVEKSNMISFLTTIIVSVLFNMGFGFTAGLIIHYLLEKNWNVIKKNS